MSEAGIENWLSQKGIEPDTIDVHGEYDSSLSYTQNLAHFKTLLKTGKGRRPKKYYDAEWCGYMGGECTRGNKEACIAACRDCGVHCSPTKTKKPRPKALKAIKGVKPIQRDVRRTKKKVCKTKVKVRAHKRKCPKRRYLK